MAKARPKRRLPGAERRELILESAGRQFGERGYAHTSLDEIAAAAGVTKPILYRHFESKKACYLALLERHRDACRASSSESRLTCPSIRGWRRS